MVGFLLTVDYLLNRVPHGHPDFPDTMLSDFDLRGSVKASGTIPEGGRKSGGNKRYTDENKWTYEHRANV